MQNFKLMSFRKSMANKFEGDLEVEVVPENRVEIKPIMEFRGKRERKATVVNLERQGNGEIFSTVINFNKKVVYKDCIWDDVERRFGYAKVVLSPMIWERIKEYQKDFCFDKGIYTFYFWRLHCLHHLMDVFFEIVKGVKGRVRKRVFREAGMLPLQLIEMSVLFKDQMGHFVPQRPFLVDSECWDQVKLMAKEFNVSIFPL